MEQLTLPAFCVVYMFVIAGMNARPRPCGQSSDPISLIKINVHIILLSTPSCSSSHTRLSYVFIFTILFVMFNSN